MERRMWFSVPLQFWMYTWKTKPLITTSAAIIVERLSAGWCQLCWSFLCLILCRTLGLNSESSITVLMAVFMTKWTVVPTEEVLLWVCSLSIFVVNWCWVKDFEVVWVFFKEVLSWLLAYSANPLFCILSLPMSNLDNHLLWSVLRQI